ncbi:uncharacterized protein LOC101859945 [Aplysia californica]|uniref:Uncharacterized protein LOC101859945 n=1 Tax=Aplysia californica TaxID=6500 RepID=A0ABM0JUE2_APLCA|nr:uncharacterized protein LOC101859945 [Aplysia californica]
MVTPSFDEDPSSAIKEWMLETYTFMTKLRQSNCSLIQSFSQMKRRVDCLESENIILKDQLAFASTLMNVFLERVTQARVEARCLRTMVENAGQRVEKLEARQGVVNDGENDVSAGTTFARLSQAVDALDVKVKNLQVGVDRSTCTT